MGRRLVAAGRAVCVYDVADAARERAEQDGAIVADSPAAVAREADVVITMLPGPADIVTAAAGPDGLLSGLRPGGVWLEMSSSHPQTTRELAGRTRDVGAAILDAPVSGGVAGAEAGTLTIMVGGARQDLERVRPVLDILGRQVVHVGQSPGDGDLAKTLNNLLSATNLTAAAEALALGMRGGLDAAPLLRCLAAGTGASHATASKIPTYALTGRFDAGFTITQYLKDLDIALDVAADLKVPMLVGSMAQQIWLRLAAMGFGNDDHTKIVALLAGEAGVALEDS